VIAPAIQDSLHKNIQQILRNRKKTVYSIADSNIQVAN
jgi:hypothetical protein